MRSATLGARSQSPIEPAPRLREIERVTGIEAGSLDGMEWLVCRYVVRFWHSSVMPAGSACRTCRIEEWVSRFVA
jgi:hypothetical protein